MIIVFALGWLSNIALISGANAEQPFSFIYSIGDVPSPKDRIGQDQIHVYDDKVVIDLDNPEWAYFTDTNSMDPVLDEGSNAIEIIPSSVSEIQVGDIVSYNSVYVDGTVIHRVIEIGYDNKGWYARMKGDNLNMRDPEKVRFDQIQRVVVAVIY